MSAPFFSIIMASTLAAYKGAASDRPRKIVRAIESVIAQSYGSWELIVVADGCRESFEIVKEKYYNDERIDCLLIEKRGGYGSVARNVGKKASKGIYIVYLDIDDVLGTQHLNKIKEGIDYLFTKDLPDVVFFDDRVATKENDVIGSFPRKCKLKRGQCGTSNIAFQRQLPVSWEDQTYLHDWVFIKSLMKYDIKIIQPCEYIVCHIPKPVGLDV